MVAASYTLDNDHFSELILYFYFNPFFNILSGLDLRFFWILAPRSGPIFIATCFPYLVAPPIAKHRC